jgi:hypothetical protein
MNTASVQLQSLGLKVQNHGIAIEVPGINPEHLRDQVTRLIAAGPADPISLARAIPNKDTEKFHSLLTEELLSADYASAKLDTPGASEALADAVGQGTERSDGYIAALVIWKLASESRRCTARV